MATASLFARLRDALKRAKREAHAVFLAARDPRVPWPVKLLAFGVAA